MSANDGLPIRERDQIRERPTQWLDPVEYAWRQLNPQTEFPSGLASRWDIGGQR